jgi:hypothetical protein
VSCCGVTVERDPPDPVPPSDLPFCAMAESMADAPAPRSGGGPWGRRQMRRWSRSTTVSPAAMPIVIVSASWRRSWRRLDWHQLVVSGAAVLELRVIFAATLGDIICP